LGEIDRVTEVAGETQVRIDGVTGARAKVWCFLIHAEACLSSPIDGGGGYMWAWMTWSAWFIW